VDARELWSVQERAACKALRRGLKAIRDFAYTESTIDHSQHDKIPFDMAIVAFEAGVVARSGDGRRVDLFTRWTIGTHKAEAHFQQRFDLYEPIEDLSLFGDCWFCRFPRGGRACRHCGTCKEVTLASRAISKHKTRRPGTRDAR
jgi:hypothetical protein